MNRKDKYNDLTKWQKACHRQRKRYYSKTAFAENHKVRWTDKDVEMVLKQEMSDTELAKRLGRSVGSIQSLRSRLKSR